MEKTVFLRPSDTSQLLEHNPTLHEKIFWFHKQNNPFCIDYYRLYDHFVCASAQDDVFAGWQKASIRKDLRK